CRPRSRLNTYGESTPRAVATTSDGRGRTSARPLPAGLAHERFLHRQRVREVHPAIEDDARAVRVAALPHEVAAARLTGRHLEGDAALRARQRLGRGDLDARARDADVLGDAGGAVEAHGQLEAAQVEEWPQVDRHRRRVATDIQRAREEV